MLSWTKVLWNLALLCHSYAIGLICFMFTGHSTLSDIRFTLNEEAKAIQTILEGYLPVFFVPPQELATVLSDIKTKLNEYRSFTLTHEDIAHYYSLQDITFARKNGYLYIKLNIPLKLTDAVFHDYWIHSAPFPSVARRNPYPIFRDFSDDDVAPSSPKRARRTLSQRLSIPYTYLHHVHPHPFHRTDHILHVNRWVSLRIGLTK